MAQVTDCNNEDLNGFWEAIIPMWDSSVGFTRATGQGVPFMSYVESTAQFDNLTYTVPALKPTLLDIQIVAQVGPDRGIATIEYDGQDIAAIDMYSTLVDYECLNVSATTSTFSGTQVSVKMDTKNASSSGHSARICHISIRSLGAPLFGPFNIITESGDSVVAEDGSQMTIETIYT